MSQTEKKKQRKEYSNKLGDHINLWELIKLKGIVLADNKKELDKKPKT